PSEALRAPTASASPPVLMNGNNSLAAWTILMKNDHESEANAKQDTIRHHESSRPHYPPDEQTGLRSPPERRAHRSPPRQKTRTRPARPSHRRSPQTGRHGPHQEKPPRHPPRRQSRQRKDRLQTKRFRPPHHRG